MSKKKQRANQVSKGERRSMSRQLQKAMRREYKANDARVMSNKMKAYFEGRNVMVTIPNPNPNETNKRFIKVKFQDAFFGGRDYKTILAGPRKAKKVSTEEET